MEPGVIAFKYTKRWSAFDRGSSSQLIPGIGVARCACAVKSFELARAAGLPTHFIEQVSDTTIHVQEFSVLGHESLSGKVHGRVLPLEWIWRDLVFGSLLERLMSGAADPVALGFAAGTVVTKGMKLPKMLLECTTKFEVMDRHLTNVEARDLAGLSKSQWDDARGLIVQLVAVTNNHYNEVDLLSPDGKHELGMTLKGDIVGVDVFGTQDENRIIDKMTGAIKSKDLIRNHLKTRPWKKLLDEAKKQYPREKSKWPDYPVLPDDLVQLVSSEYADVAKRYACAPF